MEKTFVRVHGAGDVGWSWHLVEQRPRDRGHDVVVAAAGHCVSLSRPDELSELLDSDIPGRAR